MLERIEKLQILTVGLLVVLGILIGTKTLITAFSGNVISVTGSAFEIVKSDSGSVNFNINVKRVNKQDFLRVESKLIQGENGYNIASDVFKKILDIL